MTSFRQGSDDAERLFRFVVIFVQVPANTSPKCNRVRCNETVVDDLSVERQEDGVAQDRQRAMANDFFDWIGQTDNSVGFVRFLADADEKRMLLQIAEDVELSDQCVLPTGDDFPFVGRQPSRVLRNELVDQFPTFVQSIPNLAPGLRRQGRVLILVRELLGNDCQLLIDVAEQG